MNPAVLASFIPSSQDMILIFLVVLLLFGAKKIPELARGVGKGMGEFKKAKEDFEREITRSEEDARMNRPAPAPGPSVEDSSRASHAALSEYEKDLARKEEELKAREAALAIREAAGKEAREHA